MSKRNILIIILFTQGLFFTAGSLRAQSFGWAKKMGGIRDDLGSSIATDHSGNVYSAGIILGQADLDPGPGVLNLGTANVNSTIVTKMDKEGNFLWAKAIEKGSVNSITTDKYGNIYIIGFFITTVDLDPGPGVYSKTSAGEGDIFIVKLDTNGNFTWAKTMGSAGADYGNFIALDKTGNIYFTGNFKGTVDFDPGAGVSNLIAVGSDVFICKLDSAANFIWVKKMGGSGFDWGRSLNIDVFNNIYSSGYFSGTADFNPGTGVFNLYSSGYDDVFILKLDSAGNFIWARKMGGTDYDWAYSISSDLSGNVYTTGVFSGTVNFNPNGIFNLTSASSLQDVFISKLDAAGNFVWAKRIGDSGTDYSKFILNDALGNIYITGAFIGTVDFDPGTNVFNLSSVGAQDAFILKLNAAGNFVWAKQFGGKYSENLGNSIVADSTGNLYAIGVFGDTADFDPGINVYNLPSTGYDDIFVLKLTPCIPQITNNPQSICHGSSYNINNHKYNTAGTYRDTVLSITSGCDSIITTILTVNQSTSSDTIVNTCQSFTWYGNTYTLSGTQKITIPNAEGCDSVITLHLTIDSLDSSVAYTSTTITANQQGATYQWINCKNNQSINGETNRSFTPSETGTYAAIITNGRCSDTSSCINITIMTGLEKVTALSEYVNIRPNPNNGIFMLETQGLNSGYEIIITDILGKVIFTQQNRSAGTTIDLSNSANGTYFIQLKTEHEILNRKLIINK